MELGSERASDNVEDRRGIGMGVGSFGIGGVVIAIIAAFMGYDPRDVLNVVDQVEEQAPQAQTREAPRGAPADPMGQFVSKVLASTEDVWTEIFQANGREYRKPTLVLYTGGTRTACGLGQKAMGPFYCPNDEHVYIDLAFYEDLRQRFHAPGDFAQAYVIAHEIGHHVQKLTGVFDREQSQGASKGASGTSVRMELQADCYAGVWANHANAQFNILQQGDVEGGLRAAAAVGDDTLQKEGQGYAVPDSFTHGTSAQRMRWFQRGLEHGDMNQCDTFSAAAL